MTRSFISALAGSGLRRGRLEAVVPAPSFIYGLMVASALLTLSGCSATGTDNDDASSSRRRNAIVNGTETSDYPATGMLLTQGQSICTGTVVGPRSVLTAAHCVDGADPSSLEFGFGANQDQVEGSVQVLAAVQHPQWDSQALANDVAMLTLSEDAPVAPIELNKAMDDTWIGRPVTLVGYGVSDGPSQTGGGIKRMVDVTIDKLEATTLHYTTESGQTACNGDSGGPAFADEGGVQVVVGVTSYGDTACQEYGVYTRVDAFYDFISAEIANAGGGGDPANPGDPNDPNNPGDPNDPNNPGDPADPGDPNNPGDPGADGCQGETYEGRCEGNTVIWCEEEQVQSMECGTCDFNQDAGYYDCLDY